MSLRIKLILIIIIFTNVLNSQNSKKHNIQVINDALEFEEEFFLYELNKVEILNTFFQWEKMFNNKIKNNDYLIIDSLSDFIFNDLLITSDENSIKLSDLFLNGRGNCVTISLLYMLLIENNSANIRTVNAPTHHFIRYYFDSTYINIEPTHNGASYSDEFIITQKGISKKTIDDGVYMREGNIKNLLDSYLSNLASLLFIQGDSKKALEINTQLIAKDTLNPELYYNIGLCYSKMMEYTMAISNYTNAILRDNENYLFFFERANAFNGLGRSYIDGSKFEKSIEDYSLSIELNPNFTKAYFYRGNSYFNLGRLPEACNDWMTAISLNYLPDHEYWKKYCK